MGKKQNKPRNVKLTFMVPPNSWQSHYCQYCGRKGTKQEIELHMVTACPALGTIIIPEPVNPPPLPAYKASSSGVLSRAKPKITMLITGKPSAGKTEILNELIMSFGDGTVPAGRLEENEWVVDLESHTLGLIDCSNSKHNVKSLVKRMFTADQNIFVVEAGSEIVHPPPEDDHSVMGYALGVKQLVVVVSKMDRVNYSEDMFNRTRQNVIHMLSDVGYNTAKLPVIPVAVTEGENITRGSAVNMSWYNGECLMDVVLSRMQVTSDSYRNLRLPVEEVNAVEEQVLHFTGTVAAGSLCLLDNVVLGPVSTRKTKVIDILYLDDGSSSRVPVQEAFKGHRVEVTLKHTYGEVERGCVLYKSADGMSPSLGVQAKVVFMDHQDLEHVRPGLKVTLLVHQAEVKCEIKKVSLVDPLTGRTKSYTIPQRGDTALIQLEGEQPFICEKASEFPHMGRVCVITDEDVLCVGLITRKEE